MPPCSTVAERLSAMSSPSHSSAGAADAVAAMCAAAFAAAAAVAQARAQARERHVAQLRQHAVPALRHWYARVYPGAAVHAGWAADAYPTPRAQPPTPPPPYITSVRAPSGWRTC